MESKRTADPIFPSEREGKKKLEPYEKEFLGAEADVLRVWGLPLLVVPLCASSVKLSSEEYKETEIESGGSVAFWFGAIGQHPQMQMSALQFHSPTPTQPRKMFFPLSVLHFLLGHRQLES